MSKRYKLNFLRVNKDESLRDVNIGGATGVNIAHVVAVAKEVVKDDSVVAHYGVPACFLRPTIDLEKIYKEYSRRPARTEGLDWLEEQLNEKIAVKSDIKIIKEDARSGITTFSIDGKEMSLDFHEVKTCYTTYIEVPVVACKGTPLFSVSGTISQTNEIYGKIDNMNGAIIDGQELQDFISHSMNRRAWKQVQNAIADFYNVVAQVIIER